MGGFGFSQRMSVGRTGAEVRKSLCILHFISQPNGLPFASPGQPPWEPSRLLDTSKAAHEPGHSFCRELDAIQGSGKTAAHVTFATGAESVARNAGHLFFLQQLQGELF